MKCSTVPVSAQEIKALNNFKTPRLSDLWSLCGSRDFTFLSLTQYYFVYTWQKVVINTQLIYRDEETGLKIVMKSHTCICCVQGRQKVCQDQVFLLSLILCVICKLCIKLTYNNEGAPYESFMSETVQPIIIILS